MPSKTLMTATPASESATIARPSETQTSTAVPGVSTDPMMPVIASCPSSGLESKTTSARSLAPSPSVSGFRGSVPTIPSARSASPSSSASPEVSGIKIDG